MTQDELLKENRQANIPLLDPNKPRRKKIDPSKIPREVLIRNLTTVVESQKRKELQYGEF